VKRALLLLLRALSLRCPRCGSAGIFQTMFKLREHCPRCDLQLEREAGSFTGSMTLNLVVTEIVWVLTFTGILVGTWPNPPWQLLQWGSVALMLLFPALFFPLSKTLWLALDLYFRPGDEPSSRGAPP
jgi:uncharacterized protein (DUF983 family)